MDYKKKLRLRLYIAIGYSILGLLIMILCFFGIIKNEFFSGYGLALLIIGVSRIRKYKLITKDEDSIRRQRIAETDERNISIANKARSMSFIIYIIVSGVLVITFEIMEKTDIANILAYSVCGLVFVYWITYLIIRKKS